MLPNNMNNTANASNAIARSGPSLDDGWLQ